MNVSRNPLSTTAINRQLAIIMSTTKKVQLHHSVYSNIIHMHTVCISLCMYDIIVKNMRILQHYSANEFSFSLFGHDPSHQNPFLTACEWGQSVIK